MGSFKRVFFSFKPKPLPPPLCTACEGLFGHQCVWLKFSSSLKEPGLVSSVSVHVSITPEPRCRWRYICHMTEDLSDTNHLHITPPPTVSACARAPPVDFLPLRQWFDRASRSFSEQYKPPPLLCLFHYYYLLALWTKLNWQFLFIFLTDNIFFLFNDFSAAVEH